MHKHHKHLSMPEPENLHCHTLPVRYQWSTPDGTVHHASSVVVARTPGGLRAALKRFWITNTHVAPEEA